MTYDVEHLFVCLFAICIAFFGEVSGKVFGPCFNQVISYCWVPRVLWMFWITVFYAFYKYFLSVCIFIVLTVSFTLQNFPSPVYQLFLSLILPLVFFLKSHHQTQSHLDFILLSSKSSTVLHFAFSCVIYFELILLNGLRSVSRFPFFFNLWMFSYSSTICCFSSLCVKNLSTWKSVIYAFIHQQSIFNNSYIPDVVLETELSEWEMKLIPCLQRASFS